MMRRSLVLIAALGMVGCATTNSRHTDAMTTANELVNQCEFDKAKAVIADLSDDRLSYESRGVTVSGYPTSAMVGLLDALGKVSDLRSQCFPSTAASLDEFEKQRECMNRENDNLAKRITPVFDKYALSRYDKGFDKDAGAPFQFGYAHFLTECQKKNRDALFASHDAIVQADEKRREAESAEAQVKDAAFEASPEGLAKAICNNHSWLEANEKVVKDESELRDANGVFNKVRLYQASKLVRNIKPAIEKKKQEYRTRTGKLWDPSQCGSN